MKKAVGYIRVSSLQQVNDGEGLAIQRKTIEDYCHAHGLELVRIYSDDGVSGTTLEGRDCLNQLLTDAKGKIFDTVIVHKLDRVSRDQFLTLWIQKELLTNNVQLFSISEPYRWDNPMDKLMLQMISAFAEFEKGRIVERLQAGKKRKADKGGFIGGRVPLGFDSIDGELVINPQEAKIVRLVFNHRQSGKTPYAIARLLNENGYRTKLEREFKPQTIDAILDNKSVYKQILNGLKIR